jgi:uroporphyrinogen-III synthase
MAMVANGNPVSTRSLRGRMVVITRPAGTATRMAKQVRALGGEPLLLPGLACAADDEAAARRDLRAALADDVLIFTSPAAVRSPLRLAPLRTAATVLAVGQGTARALRRHGIEAARHLRGKTATGARRIRCFASDVRGRRIALIGAPGGRGMLREQLARAWCQLRELHVYQRAAPRLDRRHVDALLRLPPSALVLLSSAEALQNLCRILPPRHWKGCARRRRSQQ